MHYPPGIVPQMLQGRWILAQVRDDGGDTMNDGIPSARKNEIRETHHLFACEPSPAVSSLHQRAEQILTRIPFSSIELPAQVVLKHDRFFKPVTTLENMDSPANICVRLRLRHIQQIREGPRLYGQRKIVDDLHRLPSQPFRQHLPDQSGYPCYHVRLLGSQKKWLYNRTIFGVLGRVGLNRQLPHRPYLFFRGNRHSKGSVRAVCLPIFGRLAHVGMAKNHRQSFSLEGTKQDTILFSGFTKRVALVRAFGHSLEFRTFTRALQENRSNTRGVRYYLKQLREGYSHCSFAS